MPVWNSRPPGWWYGVRSYLALAPIYVGRTVPLGPDLSGNVSVVVDHRHVWRAAWARLAQTPVALETVFLAQRVGIEGKLRGRVARRHFGRLTLGIHGKPVSELFARQVQQTAAWVGVAR